MNTATVKAVEDFAGNLINVYANHFGKGNFSTDPWSCCICGTVLVDAVTLVPCGHSVCKRCVTRDKSCRKCGAEIKYSSSEDGRAGLKPSILISQIVDKLWANEKRAVQLRYEGNKLFQRGEVEASIERYTQAFDLSPEDHIITSNRSHAYMKINKLYEAVRDAKYTVAMRPDWGKGYFRLGRALSGLDKPDEALVAFFHCLVLEETCSKALRAEIVQEFCTIMFKEESKMDLDGQPALDSSCSSLMQGDETGMEIDSEDQGERLFPSLATNLLPSENKQLCSLLVRIEADLSQIIEKPHKQEDRDIDSSLLKEGDFNCPLCLRLLWHPVTTSCGHTFCRSCIERNLDHRQECPMCKASLQADGTSTWGVNEFVEQSIKRLFPVDLMERQTGFEEEQLNEANIPIFVCTTSFPKVPCPLHVSEPRHRLMIRRVLETGTREFGMCSTSQNRLFADFGTMLEIRGIKYFEDGRSLLDTVGGRRFRVVERDVKDGYQVANVEFLEDAIPVDSDVWELQHLHDQTLANALTWLRCHHTQRKEGILTHFGMMPPVEESYWLLPSGPTWLWWLLAILPLDSHAQMHILSQCLLKKRLSAVNHILSLLTASNHCD